MRILFVANTWSIHTARWVNQLTDQGWDIHIFPSRDLSINPILHEVTVHDMSLRADDVHPSVKTPGASQIKRGLRYISKRLGIFNTQIGRPLVPDASSYDELNEYAMIQGGRLAALIRKIKPDIVHSLQFQY